jgi:hypothetical protein
LGIRGYDLYARALISKDTGRKICYLLFREALSMGKSTLNKALGFVEDFWNVVVQVHRDKATGMLEFELNEMENLFVLLLMGSFIGMPSPPAAMAMELMPYMEEEIRLMVSRADFAQDPLGAVMGMLNVD